MVRFLVCFLYTQYFYFFWLYFLVFSLVIFGIESCFFFLGVFLSSSLARVKFSIGVVWDFFVDSYFCFFLNCQTGFLWSLVSGWFLYIFLLSDSFF